MIVKLMKNWIKLIFFLSYPKKMKKIWNVSKKTKNFPNHFFCHHRELYWKNGLLVTNLNPPIMSANRRVESNVNISDTIGAKISVRLKKNVKLNIRDLF